MVEGLGGSDQEALGTLVGEFGWGGLQEGMGNAAATEALPTFSADLDGEAPATDAAVDSPADAVEAPAEAPTPDVEVAEVPESAPLAVEAPEVTAPEDADAEALAAGFEEALAALPATDPGLATSPGAAPSVPLEGGADPAQLTEAAAGALDTASAAQADASAAATDAVDPALVAPAPLSLETTVEVPTADTLDAGLDVTAAADFASLAADPAALAVFDAAQAGAFADTLDAAAAEIDAAASGHTDARGALVADAEGQWTAQLDSLDAERAALQAEGLDAMAAAHDEALAAQVDAVAGLEAELAAEQAHTQATVEAEIAAAEGEAASLYAQAEADAGAELAAAEGQIAAEVDSAAADQDASWWEAGLDAVGDALDTVADAVSAVCDAVMSAVDAILQAALDAASAVIDAACAFVTETVSAFGSFACGAVEDLAEQARAGLEDLTSWVSEGLDAALSAYEAAVATATGLAGAVVSGDWAEAGWLLLEAMAQAAGIPMESLEAVVGQSEELLLLVLEQPEVLLQNAGGALMQGGEQFIGGCPEHFGAGVVEWLSGATKLKLPGSLDLAGLFDLVCQVLGLSKESLKAKATEHFGAEAVTAVETAWSYVEGFLAGGFAGLWAEISADLSGLWDMVVGKLQKFLLETAVSVGLRLLAEAATVVGLGVEALVALWSLIESLQRQMQKLFGVVEGIVGGLTELAMGNLGPAADAVEKTLADLLPVAIDVFAGLAGLGDLGAVVQESVEQIRGQVDAALDGLFERLKEMVSGGEEGEEGEDSDEAPIVETFSMEDEPHTLTLRTVDGLLEVELASTPGLLLNKIRDQIDIEDERIRDAEARRATDEAAQREEAKSKLANLEAKHAPFIGAPAGDEEMERAFAVEIATELVSLGRKYGIADLGTWVGMDFEEVRQDTTIYEILTELNQELLDRRADYLAEEEGEVVAEGDEEEAQETLEKFDRAMAEVGSLYGGACAATTYDGNVFAFLGPRFFVDHQANYIFPDDQVGDDHVGLDGRVYISRTRPDTDLPVGEQWKQIEGDGTRKNLVKKYSYLDHPLTMDNIKKTQIVGSNLA